MLSRLYERLRVRLRPWVHAWRKLRLRHQFDQQQEWDGNHHPSIRQITPWVGQTDGVFLYDFLGIKTDPKFREHFEATPEGMCAIEHPHPDQTYLELLFVIDAINQSRGNAFCMIELGAGYVYWLVTAAKLLQKLKAGQVAPKLIGVEMEAGRYRWMKEHFANNGLDPDEHKLIHSAVSDHNGSARYTTPTESSAEYGLSLQRFIGWRSYRGAGEEATGFETVSCVSLKRLLQSESHVNLVHVDVQREEWVTVRHAMDELNKKVDWLLIGTHSSWQHWRLRGLLKRQGWRPIFQFPGYRVNSTPFGRIFFLDGLLCYKNPRTPSSSAE